MPSDPWRQCPFMAGTGAGGGHDSDVSSVIQKLSWPATGQQRLPGRSACSLEYLSGAE